MFPTWPRHRLRKSLLWRKFLGGISVGVHHEQIFFKRKIKPTRAHTLVFHSLAMALYSMCILSKLESSLQASETYANIAF